MPNLENSTASNKHANKTIKDEIIEALELLSPRDINELVIDYAKKDKKFRAFLLRRVPVITDAEEEKELYINQLLQCIYSAEDRNGFIGFYQSHEAALASKELLYQAENEVKNKPMKAIAIAQSVIETYYDQFGHIDDSSGDFGGGIEHAWELFHKGVKNSHITEKQKIELFEYCLAESQKKKYHGWFMDNEFYVIAGQLIMDDTMEKQLFEILDSKNQKPDMSKYERAEYVHIKKDVLQRRNKVKELEQVIQENIDIFSIRINCIEQLFEEKKYEEVKTFAIKGIAIAKEETNERDKQTLNEWLLRVAEKENDVSMQKMLLNKLFLSSYQFEFYDKLKKFYNKKEWTTVFISLEDVIAKKSHSAKVLLDMYVKEEMWNIFLSAVKKQLQFKKDNYFHYRGESNLQLLDNYQKILVHHFPQELFQLYEDVVKVAFAETTGRTYYQEICIYIKKNEKICRKQKNRSIYSGTERYI